MAAQADLIATLRLDFKPADTGDDEAGFTSRLVSYVSRALTRVASPEQQEAHARALLIGAQVRELLRQVEKFRREGKITIEQGITARVTLLQKEQKALMVSAGLETVVAAPLTGSFATSVVSEF